ncbi:SH3 domain-containing protein [Clostridium saccharobutylicum]|uniref:SH3, type 3 domain protein n=1 Tax=Clostridium saccharobutylicum DSM 13864 TaxID=1345695 RepID=U5MY05_CLOSA|nr:SH3 domain-containing protein [Clostridium saccharobutylicum]AGX44506.1 SH3, type 3 domain protein [Clostridium saccharobutylicum DSM 13864]AQR91800.1 bacterial SH3 domain protein [Clostridium saccharobutylicum]AQS01702.1 bacterial SH3 domain protein [Clostridium saccharobutylicum]AQS11308.1 bacterial SH3 domain protein [Clostridium saccharobutylicum]AQS15685.1 bacterial SH3 domain protein [Clostridium saccharobutylicum]
MDIYLIDESKRYTLQFPVNPLDSISNPKEKKFSTTDTVEFGEVDISEKGSKIREISFNSFFPLQYDSYCRYVYIMAPHDYVGVIESWMDSDTHVRLIITEFNINELVNISKFTPEIKAGEDGDIYFSITLRTYKELKIETIINASSEDSGGLENNRTDNSQDEYKDGDNVKVTASSLNVREGPGTSYDILGSVSNGTNLEIYRQYGNWADTYWGDHGGYVCLDYVTKV